MLPTVSPAPEAWPLNTATLTFGLDTHAWVESVFSSMLSRLNDVELQLTPGYVVT